jgi:hypothetical protein
MQDTAPETQKKIRERSARKSATFIFIALIIFAGALRLYYFYLTKDQPLWWDEAEYMLKGSRLRWLPPDTGWYQSHRS